MKLFFLCKKFRSDTVSTNYPIVWEAYTYRVWTFYGGLWVSGRCRMIEKVVTAYPIAAIYESNDIYDVASI